jgi:hypothetical protein
MLAFVTLGCWCHASAQTITSISPSTIVAGGPDFTLTVTGSGFNPKTLVTVNGNNRPTVFISTLQLTATIFATDITAPGTLRISVTGTFSVPPTLNLTVVNPGPAPILRRVAQGSVAQGSQLVRLTLTGANFQPGATVLIGTAARVNGAGSGGIVILNTAVLSSTVMTVLVNVGSTAPVGIRTVDVVNPDGQSTAPNPNNVGSTQPLRVESSNSLGAPLSVLNLAVTHPRDGTTVMQGQELGAEAILGGSGTGTVIGQWVWDGNVVEQFSASVVGGQASAIQTRQSLPTWFLGIHTLQLRIVQPNQVATRTISVVVNPGDWRLEAITAPPYGAVFAPDNPPLLRWSPVPGAAKYQVGFSTRPYLSTIETWYDSIDNRWQVPVEVWRKLPEGELFWTVRTLETSGQARKPLPMRSIFRSSEGGLTAAHTTPGKTPAGATLLEWKPVATSAFYMVTVSSDREGINVLRRYLTSTPQVDLRALDRNLEAGKTYFWRVNALTRSGKLMMSGQPQSFVAGPGPKAGLRSPDGELIQLAALGMPAGLSVAPLDLNAQIAKRSPDPNSSVANAQPPVSVEFQAKVNPAEVSLMLDTLDVTAMSEILETKISYTPAMPLAGGDHTLNLTVGTETISWKFSVTGGSAEPPASTPTAGRTQPGTDAEVPPATVTNASSAPAPAPAGQPVPTPAATETGPHMQLSQDQQFSSNTQWASGGNPPATNGLTMAERFSFQNGAWHADVNGSGLVTSILNPEPQRTIHNHVNDYVMQLGYQGQQWSTNLRFGILAPVLYTDAQFVTAATPRQAIEGVLTTRAGILGYFTNTSDAAPGGGAGVSFHQRIMGASWFLPLPKKWVELRFMWLKAQDEGTPTIVTFDTLGHPVVTPDPLAKQSKGSVYGGVLLIHLKPTWLWTSEYALSHVNLDSANPASESRWGRAWRTGILGQQGKTVLNVAYRDVGPNFGNPANPALTVASKPDLRGVDATVTQTTNAGTFGLGYTFLQNNVHPVDSPELMLHTFNQSWSKPFGVKTNLIVVARESLTQTGTVPASLLLLPENQRGLQDLRDVSGNIMLSRQIGTVTMSVGGIRDWNRNNLLPTADTITSAITLGANFVTKGFFQLNSQVNFNWIAAEKFSIGETRNITAYLQPSFVWTSRGVQVSPLLSVTQGRTLLATGTLTNDTLTGQYGGRLSWTPPGVMKFNTFSVQGSYNQNRNNIAGLDLRGTQLLVLWTATWGQKRQVF